MNQSLQVTPYQVFQSAANPGEVTLKRISDARLFRQRSAHGSAELTLRLEHENINQVWAEMVSEAKEAAKHLRFDRAEQLWNAAIQYSTNPQQLAYSCSHLAEFYYSQKEYSKAEPVCLKVLSLYVQHEELIGRADLATALHNAAFLYQAMKDFDKAEHFYLESMRIRTELFKLNDPIVDRLINDYKGCIRARNERGILNQKIPNSVRIYCRSRV